MRPGLVLTVAVAVALLGCDGGSSTAWRKYHEAGVAEHDRGKLADAERHLERAVEEGEAAFGPRDLRVARSLVRLGRVRHDLGRFPEAERA